MDNKQAILGFTEFFKGITGNQNLEIPSEIAEKIGLQAQADGDIITALCSLPKIISEDGQDYVQLFDVLKTVKRYTAKADDGVAIPSAEPKKCKDCKWWKDSDGAFRRGIRAESKCPMNRIEVFEGNGYCYMFEPQESEDKE